LNSYHGEGIANPGSMSIAARATDGSIEAADSGPKLGIMWHPERAAQYRDEDLDLFRTFFA
jgi:putative glutamine amidotransferase